MAALTELRNEWSEAVAATRAINEAEIFDEAAYERAWEAQQQAQERYERAARHDAAERALNDARPKLTDLRDPDDAGRDGFGEPGLPNVPPRTANRVPERFIDLGNGRIVPYATKSSEGYVRGYPAAVQMRTVVARYGPELRAEAEAEREAFAAYVRYGERSRAFNDQKLAGALQRLNARNALQEGTDSEGGYLVPTDERTDFGIEHDPGAMGGVTRAVSRVLTTSRDAGTIPAGTTVTWGPIAEEATPDDSEPVFSQIAFTIRKSGFNDTVSEELLADSAFNVPAFLAQVGAEERGRYEDQQAIEGDGATEPLGLRTTGANQGDIGDVTGLIPLTAPTKAEILAAYFELPAQFRNAGTRWHTTSSLLAKVAAIPSAGGDLSLVPRLDGAPGFTLLGHPVVLFDGTGWDSAAAIAANEELGAIGDFARKYVFMDRLGVVFRRDDSVGFRSDQVAFKMRVRYDSFFTEHNAFRILKAAAS